MARIYDVESTSDIEVMVDEFWDAADSLEKDELKELVMNEYGLNSMDSLDGTIINYMGSLAQDNEAKEYIRRIAADLDWRLKIRDFS